MKLIRSVRNRTPRSARAVARSASVLGVVALASLAACVSGAPAKSVGAAKIGRASADVQLRMRDFKLPSGLRVIVEEDHAAPIAGVINFVGVGSSSDPPGKEGLAHLVEHLAFRAKHASMHGRTVWTLLEIAGGGDVNAWTGLDATAYHEAGSRDSLADLLAIETMRMENPLEGVDEAVFATEREVVRNELRERTEMGYAGNVFGELQAALFPVGHPYARPGVGTHASLSSITLDDARAFVAKHYVPSNMTLVIEGDVALDGIGKLLDARIPPELRNAPAGGPKRVVVSARLPAEAPKPPEPPPVPAGGMRKVESSVATPELYIGWSLPRSYDQASYLATFVAASASGALSRSWSEDTDIVGVSVEELPGTEATIFLCKVTLKEGTHPEKSLDHVLNQLQRTWEPDANGGDARLDDVAFDQARRRSLTNLLFDAQDSIGRGERRAALAHFMDDPTAYATSVRKVAELNRGAVARYAYDYLTRSRARAVLVTKTPVGALDQSSLRGLARTPEDEGAEKITYDVGSIATVAIPPNAASFRQVVLPNGLEVVIAHHGGLPIANVGLLFKGGASLEAKPSAASFSRLISSSGKPKHGRLSNFGAWESDRLHDDSATRMLSLPSQNLADALEVLADKVESLHAETEGQRYFERYLVDYYAKWDARPENVSARAFQRALFGNHPYGHMATGEEMSKLTTGDVNDWLGVAYGPKNAVLAIVGGVDENDAEELARKYFGGWGGSAAPAPLPAPAPMTPRERIVVTSQPGATQASIRIGCVLPPAHAEQASVYDVAAGAMGERLATVLRREMGASYGFHGYSETERGGISHIEISGNVENGALAPALKSIRALLVAKGQDALPDAQFDRARWLSAERYNVRLASSASLAFAILAARNNDEPLVTIDDRPRYLAQMTRAPVEAAVTTCGANAVVSIVGDEPKIRAALAAQWH